MFNSYYDFVSYADNWPFVLPLSTNHEGSQKAFKPDLHECIKFVGLSYFRKHRGLFANKAPGRQVGYGLVEVASGEHE